jgi:plasmid stabilization system protein ParE
VTINALKNFDEITGYIGIIRHQPLNAIKVGDKIMAAIDRIAANPTAFRECEVLPTRSKIYRRAVCLSWQIIYKIGDVEIVILGILHTSRKPTSVKKLRKVK